MLISSAINDGIFVPNANERIINNRSTIVTTNLSPDGIIDRYGERIFSRLFNKQNSLKINFTNTDLRLKK